MNIHSIDISNVSFMKKLALTALFLVSLFITVGVVIDSDSAFAAFGGVCSPKCSEGPSRGGFWPGDLGGGASGSGEGGGGGTIGPGCVILADRYSLEAPGTVTLNWATRMAATFAIDNGVGPLDVSKATFVETGSVSVFVPSTTTYTGVGVGTDGTPFTCQLTIPVGTPPPPADVCPNIDGTQTSIPAGYQIVNGQCVLIPPPPVDVCPNIAGDQASVPSGYQLVNGQCVIITTTTNPPQCELTLTRFVISWSTIFANLVTIIPLTNSPAVPGASGGTQTGGTSVWSGDFGAFKAQYASIFQTDATANGGVTLGNASFKANKATADRLCTLVFPGSVNGSFQTDTFASPGNNTIAIWNGLSWSVVPARGNDPHLRYAFSCVTQTSSSGTHPLSGSHTFVPPLGVGTHTYRLTATGPDGVKQCDATVVVPPDEPPPTDVCPNIAGTQTSIPEGHQLINGQCVVIPPNSPLCTLVASPTTVGSGGASTLVWTTQNATSFSINGIIDDATPVAAGSISVSPSITTTYTGTATNISGQSVVCTATVQKINPSVPACVLSVNRSKIKSGESVKVSWTSANVTSGTITSVGNATPVASGTSDDLFPPDSTTYTGTFTGPNGSVSCTVSVEVEKGSGGCVGNCGGGGLNQPNVTLLNKPGDQPLAFVSLSQVPYTGFEAGVLLTILFWLAVAVWSAGIAYIVVGKQGMRLMASQLMSGASYTRSATPSQALVPSVIHVAEPVQAAAPQKVTPLRETLEAQAHREGVLLSPEALEMVLGVSTDPNVVVRTFTELLQQAVKTLPREDGWILLSSDRVMQFAAATDAPVPTPAPVAPTPVASPLPRSSDLLDSAVEQLVKAVLEGNRDNAFALVREFEAEAVPATSVVTGVTELVDRLYHARKVGASTNNPLLDEKVNDLPEQALHELAIIFANALGATYALPYTGLKIALAQAFDKIN